MYQAFNDFANMNYNYWNHHQMEDLNYNKMHLNPLTNYYMRNRSYELNHENIYAMPSGMPLMQATAAAAVPTTYDLNDYNIYKSNFYSGTDQMYQPYIDNNTNNIYSNYEVWNYQQNDHHSQVNRVKQAGLAGSINDENDEWSEYSDSIDNNLKQHHHHHQKQQPYHHNNKNNYNNKKINQESYKRLKRNQGCLSNLIEGDLIEYVLNEDDLDLREALHYWAIYMGNSMIMRFDNKRKLVVYESYWKIANDYYIYINRDLDKKLLTLPIYEILKRARRAHAKSTSTNVNVTPKTTFSSDKNFATWCRFDINKSDIELATDKGKYSSKLAKDFLLKKFFLSLEKQIKK